MYSSLQQQCLIELGIVPYDLNDQYQQPSDVTEPQSAKQLQTTKARPQSIPQPQVVKAVPVEAAPVEVLTPAETPVLVDHWGQCSAEFVKDLTVLFPDIKLSVHAFNTCVAQLKDNVFWNIDPKVQVQYVQLESIGQNTVITSPFPSEISLSQKKELWLLLQPLAVQLTTES